MLIIKMTDRPSVCSTKRLLLRITKSRQQLQGSKTDHNEWFMHGHRLHNFNRAKRELSLAFIDEVEVVTII